MLQTLYLTYRPANTENKYYSHGTSVILGHWLASYHPSHRSPSVVCSLRFLLTTSGRTQRAGERSLSIIQPQESRCVKSKKQTRYVLSKSPLFCNCLHTMSSKLMLSGHQHWRSFIPFFLKAGGSSSVWSVTSPQLCLFLSNRQT